MGIEVFPSIGIGIGIEVCQIRGIGIGIGIAQMIFWVLVLVLRLKIVVLSVSGEQGLTAENVMAIQLYKFEKLKCFIILLLLKMQGE